jgi:sugar (pentulose or hexulose) kinase
MPGSKFLTINPGTMPDDNGLSFIAKASGINGGLTIVAAHLVTGVAGTFDVILQNYGSAGTVAGGTMASMASGTATVWAADTPQSLTVSTTAANLFLDAGEWMVMKKTEAAGGNDYTADATLVVEYVDGVATAG